MDPHSIVALQKQYQEKTVSPVEVCQHYLDRIKKHDQQINSFISVTEDLALHQAKAAEAAYANGSAKALTGIPIAHKDIFCTRDIKTSCGSKMLDNFISPYDATLVKQLQTQGAITLGKTNMDEFAMGSANVTSFYQDVKNPWDLNCVPGGSSGGSAAAVAAQFCLAATGTDTGGSIRQPAAFCGITGLKPTYGSISRFGMIAFASSLDQAGPMARSAEDVALLLEQMVAKDPNDSTSIQHPNTNFSANINESIAGKKIGLPRAYFSSELNSDIAQKVEAAAKQLEALGAELVEIDINHSELAVPCYYIIAPAEASSNLSRYDGIRFGHRAQSVESLEELYVKTRSEGFGAEVKRRILIGTYVLSSGYFDAYYVKAQQIRRMIRDEVVKAFEQVDASLCPTTPTTAFSIDEAHHQDPVQMYLSDLYTIAVNLAGLPALSMPCGFVDNRPVGCQLIGSHFGESTLLNLAHQYQLHTAHHQAVAKFEAGE